MKSRIDKDFLNKNYFQFVQQDPSTDPSDILEVAKGKMRGNFTVNIKPSLEP